MLLQVYLHAAIAAQAGEFDIEDVAAGLREKMLRRNPHVFGDVEETDPARINETWEAVKAAEKERAGLLDGIPLELPALSRAAKVLDRLERAGRPLPAARPPTTRTTWATGCWRSWPRPGRPGSTPSRPCATPYDGSARDPSAEPARASLGCRSCWSCSPRRVHARRGRRDGAAAHAHGHRGPRRPDRPCTGDACRSGTGDVSPADVVWAQGSVLHVGRRTVDLRRSRIDAFVVVPGGVFVLARRRALVHRPVRGSGAPA